MYKQFISICKKELKMDSNKPSFILHKGKEYICNQKVDGYIEINVEDDIYGCCMYIFDRDDYNIYFYDIKELRKDKLLKLGSSSSIVVDTKE